MTNENAVFQLSNEVAEDEAELKNLAFQEGDITVILP